MARGHGGSPSANYRSASTIEGRTRAVKSGRADSCLPATPTGGSRDGSTASRRDDCRVGGSRDRTSFDAPSAGISLRSPRQHLPDQATPQPSATARKSQALYTCGRAWPRTILVHVHRFLSPKSCAAPLPCCSICRNRPQLFTVHAHETATSCRAGLAHTNLSKRFDRPLDRPVGTIDRFRSPSASPRKDSRRGRPPRPCSTFHRRDV